MTTANSEDREEQERRKRFAAAVSRQGYAFQNAVIKRVEELHEARKSKWVFEAAEFPVEVNANGTRIDFILWTHQTNYWLLAECKRVNPRLADWFFTRTPYVRRNHHEQFIAEHVREEEDGQLVADGIALSFPPDKLVSHRGFEVKTAQDGDTSGGREAIEEAAGQIMKGMNGLVAYFNRRRSSLGPKKRRVLLPVVFTTANLWVSENNMTDSDLLTGNIDPQQLKLEKVPYVYYQYHVSPGIKHSFVPDPHQDSPLMHEGVSAALVTDFIRTVPVVSAAGIDQFLHEFWPDALFVPRPIFS